MKKILTITKYGLLCILYGLFHYDGIEALKPKGEKRIRKTIKFVYKVTNGEEVVFIKESGLTKKLIPHEKYYALPGIFFLGVVKYNFYIKTMQYIETITYIEKTQRVSKKNMILIKEKMEANGWLLKQ